jgi:hypothetical protein
VSRSNSKPDLTAEITVDHGYFPYKVKLGEKLVAHLYTSTLIDAFRHVIKRVEEHNQLIREYNTLVDALKGRVQLDPNELKYKKQIEILSESADEFFRVYGVKVGQVWKTKGSHHHYEVTDIKQNLTLVTLLWLGPYKYTRDLGVENLKRKYELIEDANKVAIKAATAFLEGKNVAR